MLMPFAKINIMREERKMNLKPSCFLYLFNVIVAIIIPTKEYSINIALITKTMYLICIPLFYHNM